jgi:hypothetical protein
MSRIAPKPIIADVLQTWRVPQGMVYSLVADVEQNVWIVESCPAGTHFWTVEQATQLPQGSRTRAALQEAVRLGRLLEKETRVARAYGQQTAKAGAETVLSWLENPRSPIPA